MSAVAVKPTRAELVAEYRVLLAKGCSSTEIAAMYGKGCTSVRNLLADPDGAKQRARRSRYQGRCIDCGATTDGSNGRAAAAVRCAPCAAADQHAHKHWTRERIIAAIQEWAATHGRPPTATDWRRSGTRHPATSNVFRTRSARNNPFASWAEAIEAAGFERPENGGRYRERRNLWKFDHDEALRLLGEGLTGAEVARRLGISHTTVSRLKLSDGGTFAQRRVQPTAEEVGRPSRSTEASG